MSDQVEVSLFNIVGSGVCTASEDGQKVYDVTSSALRSGKSVCLSFDKVEDLTSAFLNSAVGKLYGEFSEEEIKSKLSVSNASPDDIALLKRVINRAKEFFKDPERFRKAKKEMLGGEDDPR
jgi:hypothetical protein